MCYSMNGNTTRRTTKRHWCFRESETWTLLVFELWTPYASTKSERGIATIEQYVVRIAAPLEAPVEPITVTVPPA